MISDGQYLGYWGTGNGDMSATIEVPICRLNFKIYPIFRALLIATPSGRLPQKILTKKDSRFEQLSLGGTNQSSTPQPRCCSTCAMASRSDRGCTVPLEFF